MEIQGGEGIQLGEEVTTEVAAPGAVAPKAEPIQPVDLGEEVQLGEEVTPVENTSFLSPETEASLKENADFSKALEISNDPEYALRLTQNMKPEEAAKVAEFARYTNFPKDAIFKNIKTIEDYKQAREAYDKVMGFDEDGKPLNPFVREWFSDPHRAAMSKSSADALTEYEYETKLLAQEREGTGQRIFRNLMSGSYQALKSLTEIPALIQGASTLAPVPMDSPVMDYMGVDQNVAPKSAKELGLLDFKLTKYLDEQAQKYQTLYSTDIVDLAMKGDYAGAGRAAFSATIENIPNMVAIGMAGVLSGGTSILPGLATAGAMAGAQAQTKYLEEGVSPQKAAAGALTYGFVEGLFEQFTAKQLLGFGKQFPKLIGEKSTKEVLMAVGKEFFTSFRKEGMSEWNTQLGQGFVDWAMGEKTTLPAYFKDAVNAFIVGGIMGGSMSGFSSVAQVSREKAQYEKSMARLKNMEAVVDSSKLTSLDKESQKEFIDGVLDTHQVDPTVYVSPKAIEKYNQSKTPKQKQDALDQLGVTQEQLDEANKTGTAVPVKISNKMTAEPTLRDAINTGLQFSEEGITDEEIKQNPEKVRKMVAETLVEKRTEKEEGFPPELEQIRSLMIAPKNEGGFGKVAAQVDQELSIFDKMLSTLATDNKMTKAELLRILTPELQKGLETLPEDQAGVEELLKQNNEVPQGTIAFVENKALITLGKASNKSTFLHESMHYFVKLQQRVNEKGVASEQTKANLAALEKFAGKFDVQGHEKIARAFEEYLSEGKAPSVELADAFKAIRTWLRTIYKNIKEAFGENLNDEVRGVFDRMIASEEDIQLAKEYYGAKKSFVDFLMPEVTEEEKAKKAEVKRKLEEKRKKADESSINKQTKKYLWSYLKTMGMKKALEASAKATVEKQEIYKTINAIKEKGAMSKKALVDLIGEKAAEETAKKHPGLFLKNGKKSLSAMALEYGFESPEDFAETLSTTEKQSVAEKQELRKLMIAKENELKAEVESGLESTPGQESYHTDERFAYILAELNVLADAAAKAKENKATKIEAKAYVDAAKEIIDRKSLSESVRYYAFSKAEQRATNRAYALIEEGKLDEAVEAKDEQLLNHELVRQAVKARDYLKKLQNFYTRKNLKGKLAKTENGYINILAEIISSYGLSDLEYKESKTSLENRLFDLDENIVDSIPHWVLEKRGAEEGYKNLSFGQVTELHEAILSIFTSGKEALDSITLDNAKNVDDIVAKTEENLSTLKDVEAGDVNTKLGGIKNWLMDVSAELTSTSYMFEKMDLYSFTKNKMLGLWGKIFKQGMAKEAEQKDLKTEVFNNTKGAWTTLAKAVKRIEAIYGGRSFVIQELLLPAEIQRELKLRGKMSWTVNKLISIVLNSGNEGNLNALKEGNGLTDSQINFVREMFTKEELEAVQNIWDATEKLFPKIDAVNFRLTNRHLKTVEAMAVETKTADGKSVKLRGGYFPLAWDRSMSKTAARFAEDAEIEMSRNAVLRSSTPPKGFTKERQGGRLPVRLDAEFWFQHIDDSTRYIAFTEYTRDLNRITSNTKFERAFTAKMGAPKYAALRDWVKFLAHPKRLSTGGFLDALLEKQRQLGTGAILGLSLGTAVKQMLALLNTASEIGLMGVLRGLRTQSVKSILGFQKSEVWAEVLKKSSYLRTRAGNIDREIHDATSRMSPLIKKFNIGGKEFTWRDVQDFSFEWISMMDRSSVGIAWMGAYQTQLEKLSSLPQEEADAQAIEYADKVVERTQASSIPIELTMLQRKEGAWRLFSSFMTWSLKWGGRMNSYIDAYKSGAISTKQFVRHIMYEHLGQAWGSLLISELMSGALFGGEDDDKEMLKWLMAPVDNALSWIPIVREIPGMVIYGGSGGKRIGESPAFEAFNRVKKAYQATGRAMDADSDEEYMKMLWAYGSVAEIYAGIPAVKLVKSAVNTYDIISGNKE